jgi:RNA polymerase sigma factor FliA
MIDAADEDAAWTAYEREPTVANRDRIILIYLAWCYKLADMIAKRIGVDKLDSRQEAVFGLMEAIPKFDRSRGLKFVTFAFHRIRGEIIDASRVADHLGRVARSRIKLFSAAIAKLEAELHRKPTDSELAESLGIEPASVPALEMQAETAAIKSIDSPSLDDPYFRRRGMQATVRTSLVAGLADPRSQVANPAADFIEHALTLLHKRDRFILRAYYFHNRTFAQIASRLGISESMVSMDHRDAMFRLRSRLEALEEMEFAK